MNKIDFEEKRAIQFKKWLEYRKEFSENYIESIVIILSDICEKFGPLMCGLSSFYQATTEREINLIFDKLSSDSSFYEVNINENCVYLDAVQLYYEFVVAEQNTRYETRNKYVNNDKKKVATLESSERTTSDDSRTFQKLLLVSTIDDLTQIIENCEDLQSLMKTAYKREISENTLDDMFMLIAKSRETIDSLNALIDTCIKKMSDDESDKKSGKTANQESFDDMEKRVRNQRKEEGLTIESPLKNISDIELVLDRQKDGNEIEIGQYVQLSLKYLLNKGLLSDRDINNLLDKDWSKKTFHISHALLREYDFSIELSLQTAEDKYKCYWNILFPIIGKNYLACCLWYETNRKYFDKWLNLFADPDDIISELLQIDERKKLREQQSGIKKENELISFPFEYNSLSLPKELTRYIFLTIKDLYTNEAFINLSHLNDLVSARIKTETIYDDSFIPVTNILNYLQDVGAIIPYNNGTRGNFTIKNDTVMSQFIDDPNLVKTYALKDDF